MISTTTSSTTKSSTHTTKKCSLVQETETRTGTMDFKVLSRYDDLFTDVFLDNLFLWFDTIKMNHDHRRPRVPNQKILAIVQKHLLENGKINDAVTELLQMDYFRHYLAQKSPKQKQEFVQHMKRYLYMYMPNAGYEIGDTRRYCMTTSSTSDQDSTKKSHHHHNGSSSSLSGRRVEACLIATKEWHTGDEMRLLTGMIACLDPDSDAELRMRNRDFSVMWSTRKNCNCLFLGPARFANHDCDSNCKFIAMGQNVITFKVLKDIHLGEEITVYYGKHYFGQDNSECKCKTCEDLGMGYFASFDDSSTSSFSKENTPMDDEHPSQGAKRRSTRKRKSALYEDYISSLQSPQRATKRLSMHKDVSLEELIAEEENKHDPVTSIPMTAASSSSPLTVPIMIKKEPEEVVLLPPSSSSPLLPTTTITTTMTSPLTEKQQRSIPEEPIMPISPTTATTARLKVMSIDFLCGSSDEDYKTPTPALTLRPQQPREQRRPSMLDLLVDAAMDAGYLNTDKKETSSPSAPASFHHADAAPSSFSSINKADSAPASFSSNNVDSGVSFMSSCSTSPPAVIVKKELTDEDFNALDDFLDDVSDLSSVSSTELSFSASDDDNDDDQDKTTVSRRSRQPNNNNNHKQGKKEELVCIACERPLRRQDISEQVGVDVAITNELATWTWSPSAIFTDWRPKRCPRCERHYTIFRQEWPHRKVKKKKKKKPMRSTFSSSSPSPSPSPTESKESNKKKKKKSVRASTTVQKQKKKNKKTQRKADGTPPLTVTPTLISQPLDTTCSSSSPLLDQHVTAAATVPATHQLAMALEEEEGLPPVIYQIQDDPNDLNYIPPSPLSEFEQDDF